MAKSRRQDMGNHRSDRDTIQKLKAVIRNLRKQVSQLRRQLNKQDDLADDFQELLDAEVEREQIEEHTRHKALCPKCQSEVEAFTFAEFSLLRCSNKFCDWRKKTPVK